VIVSLLREYRPGELRVLLLPPDAGRLCEICDLEVETGAGRGLGIPDEAYARAGARITSTTDAWERADFLLKLKAPTLAEVQRIKRGASIAALFHAEATRMWSPSCWPRTSPRTRSSTSKTTTEPSRSWPRPARSPGRWPSSTLPTICNPIWTAAGYPCPLALSICR